VTLRSSTATATLGVTHRWSTIGFGFIAVVLLGLGARIAYLCALYFSGSPSATRFQIETSALWFIIVGLILAVLRTTQAGERPFDVRRHVISESVLWVLGAVALYWPAFGIGFLVRRFRAHRASVSICDRLV
jgi:hypothetical protein